ncbi:XdhC/CoxI family protein [uncultured Merdimonas sp.]|uniref:XdhC family protein n=1 Tax=uncultured Merdimonas sp. TaxID=2023269 RepID=UPI003208C1B7
MKQWMEVLEKLMEEDRSAVLATVTDSKGSVPRKAGARMIVGKEGRIFGSIGGGILEHQGIRAALRALEEKKSCQESFDLSGETAIEEGMICGGSLQVEFRYLSREMDGFEEVFEELRKEAQKERKAGKVYIFGGGHVAQALAQVLVFLGFSCVILEDREEFLKKELFPGEVQLRRIDNQRIGESVSIREEDCVCIMTRGHKDDLVIEAQVLQTKASYIGVIGSRRKAAVVAEKLRTEYHISPEEIGRIHTPIGLPIGAETPEEIAVSIAAELIRHRAGYGTTVE